MSHFQDQVVLITGSSRGIGKETARQFLRENARVIITGRSLSNLQKAEKELKSSLLASFCLDLKDFTQIQQLFRMIRQEFGQLDILVNNAGVSLSGPFAGHSAAELKEILDINLKAVLFCVR